MKHFRAHPLLYVLVLLCVFAVAASFFRFIVAEDYIVEYEGECDPIHESCFIGCADDECLEEYYHSWVRKNATDVYAQCGPDVTDCAEAGICLPSDTYCEILYCSPETSLHDETCEDLDESSVIENTGEEDGLEEDEGEATEETEETVESEDGSGQTTDTI